MSFIEFVFVLSFIPIMGLIFTIIMEFIVYSIAIRKDFGKLFLYAILINLFTWSIANFIYGFNPLYLFFIEFFVFIVEMFLITLLMRIKLWKALIISLIANLLTMLLGIIGFQ